jgi:hypothetical protein
MDVLGAARNAVDSYTRGLKSSADAIGDTGQTVYDTGRTLAESEGNLDAGAEELFGESQWQSFSRKDGLGKAGAAIEGGVDVAFDNPIYSIQDQNRRAVGQLLGTDSDEETAQAMQRIAKQAEQTTQQTVEGTALDNPVTDGVAWTARLIWADAATAGVTAGTGVDLRTGEADQQVDSISYLDSILTIGTGGTASLVGKGGKAASAAASSTKATNMGLLSGARKLIGKGDEVAKLGDDVAGATDDLASGSKRLDDVNAGLYSGRYDETASVADNLDDFDSLSRGIATGDNYLGNVEDFSRYDEVFINAPKAGAQPTKGIGASIDELVKMDFEDFSDASKFGRVSDEIAAGSDDVGRSFDEVFGSTRQKFDDSMNAADDALGRTMGKGDDVVDTASGTVRNYFDSIRSRLPSTRATIAVTGLTALGTGVALKTAGYLQPKVPDEQGTYSTTTHEYPKGGLRVQVKKGEKQLGFAVVIGEHPTTKALMVLDSQAEPREMTGYPNAQKIPKATFESAGGADDAYYTFLDRLESGSGDDTTTASDYPRSSLFTGSLGSPKRVTQSESFNVEYQIQAKGQKAESRFVLAVLTGNGPVGVGEVTHTVDPQTPTSGTISVPSVGDVAPGNYGLALVSTDKGAGLVADTAIEVLPAGSGQSQWQDPEIVKELPMGWYLVAQAEKGGPRSRFFIVGRRSDGRYIYLHQDGRARTEPFPFATPQKATNAMRSWMQRLNNGRVRDGEVPSTDADRPDMSRVHRDVAAYDAQGKEGVMNPLTGSPLKAGALVFVLVVAAYLLYRRSA